MIFSFPNSASVLLCRDLSLVIKYIQMGHLLLTFQGKVCVLESGVPMASRCVTCENRIGMGWAFLERMFRILQVVFVICVLGGALGMDFYTLSLVSPFAHYCYFP